MSFRRLLPLLTVALLLLGAGAGTASAAQLNVLSTQSQFECVSCHEPLNEVDSPQAIAEKDFLQGLIDKGDDFAQVKQAMVNAYGVVVLVVPPAKGFNLLVYVLPPVAALGGLLLLAVTLPRWRRRAREIAPLQSAEPLDSVDEQRLREELERFR